MRIWTVAIVAALAANVAQAETRRYNFNNFNAVDVGSGLVVEIGEGRGYVVQAEGTPTALGRLLIAVQGTTLFVRANEQGEGFLSGLRGVAGNAARVQVMLPTLSGVAARAGAEVSAQGATGSALVAEVTEGATLDVREAKAAQVRLWAGEGGQARFEGRCGVLQAEAQSGAVLDASGLECESAQVQASTGGRAEVSAGIVQARAVTGAHVELHGARQIETDEASGGSVGMRD